jgi:quinol-cytochrome oxidoreductase complex cytochrome b subunit
MRIDKMLLRAVKKLMVDLPCPLKIRYGWNFGSLLGITFVFQLLSGILLSFHYVSDVKLAFSSVDMIMREVSWG